MEGGTVKRILVIGIGSRLMRDDGIGSSLAEALQSGFHEQNVEVVAAETDFAFGLETIQEHDYVVLLDAVQSGRPPGNIAVYPLKAAAALQKNCFSQHEPSLVSLITQKFEDIQGCLIGIEAAEIGLGFGLSLPLREKYAGILAHVKQKILTIMEEQVYA